MIKKTRRAKTTKEHLEECGTIKCRGYFGCTSGPDVPNKSKYFYKATECGKLTKYAGYGDRDNPYVRYFVVGICEECEVDRKFTNYYKILRTLTLDQAIEIENERIQGWNNWRKKN